MFGLTLAYWDEKVNNNPHFPERSHSLNPEDILDTSDEVSIQNLNISTTVEISQTKTPPAENLTTLNHSLRTIQKHSFDLPGSTQNQMTPFRTELTT